MKRTINIIPVMALAAAMLAGCATEAPQNSPASSPQAGGTELRNDAVLEIGQGSTVFVFEATDDTGETTVWNVSTDEATVGAALLAAGLIEGDVSEFGLMVTYVNGLRADYEEDGAYWAFYIDGEFAMTGADATDIEQGKVYSFVYTAA